MRLLLVSTALLTALTAVPATAADTPKVKPYPLTTCIVSGEKFGGEMGEPIVRIYGDREIKLCCKPCVRKFEKDQAGYLAKLAEAEAAAVRPVTPAPAKP